MVLGEKWLTLIVLSASIIQLPSSFSIIQVCPWNTALWEKIKRYWCKEFALPNDQERYDSTWQIFKFKKMTFSGYLNVFNLQRVLLAARKTDAIALQLYAYFWRKDFPTDAKTWTHYLVEIKLCLVFTLDFVSKCHNQRLAWAMEFLFFTNAVFTEIRRCSSWKGCTFI